MKRTMFIADRWVKFTFNNAQYIGITFIFDVSDSHEPRNHLIFYITNKRDSGVLNFHECMDLKYLEFVKKPFPTKKLLNDSSNDFTDYNDIMFDAKLDLIISPKLSKKVITTLAKNQRFQLFMN